MTTIDLPEEIHKELASVEIRDQEYKRKREQIENTYKRQLEELEKEKEGLEQLQWVENEGREGLATPTIQLMRNAQPV